MAVPSFAGVTSEADMITLSAQLLPDSIQQLGVLIDISATVSHGTCQLSLYLLWAEGTPQQMGKHLVQLGRECLAPQRKRTTESQSAP